MEVAPGAHEWGSAIGYHYAEVNGYAETHHVDDASRPDFYGPLAAELSSNHTPLTFISSHKVARLSLIDGAKMRADLKIWKKVQPAFEAARNARSDEATLRDAILTIKMYAARYAPYLHAKKEILTDAQDHALKRLAEISVDIVTETAADWSAPSLESPPVAVYSLPVAYAETLARRLHEGGRPSVISDLYEEIKRVSAHFTDPRANRILATALVDRFLSGLTPQDIYDEAELREEARALHDLIDGLKIDSPASDKDAGLQEWIVRKLFETGYKSSERRYVALKLIGSIGERTRSLPVRLLAYRFLGNPEAVALFKDNKDYVAEIKKSREAVLTKFWALPAPLNALPHPEEIEEYRLLWQKAVAETENAKRDELGKELARMEALYPALRTISLVSTSNVPREISAVATLSIPLDIPGDGGRVASLGDSFSTPKPLGQK